ncbi:YhgE/Pip family protein [Cytobacillus sp. Hz8]|uniref:YhgE/Pip family protein n=1 Tax=Cytobacillus sp. Hz8 TaxID=3347168 RepID=UPI0035D8B50F
MGRSLIGAELKDIITNRKVLIPIIAVLIVPVLYAGMFMWAFWDPYAHLESLPVAVVNNDTGANFEGENLDIGKELVKEIKKSDEFKFTIVNKKEAYNDLEKQKYYMVVEIPKNFSENATTLLDDHPKKLELKYIPNEGYNFLSGQIGNTAMLNIQASLQEKVTKTYTETIFEKIKEMSDGFTQASDGAGQLKNGAIKLSDGAEKIKENLTTLANKSIEFKEGVLTADDGSKQLAEGTKELNSGLSQLKQGHNQLLYGTKATLSGTNQLASGIGQVQAGLNQVDTKMNDLIKGTNDAKTGVAQFNSQLPELEKNTEALATGSAKLDAGINQFEQQLTSQLTQASKQQLEQLMPYLQKSMTPEQLAALQKQLNDQNLAMQKQIAAGFDQLKSGSSQVAAGTAQLNKAVSSEISPNISKLNAGLTQISDGQTQLKAGIHSLAFGSNNLNTGVQQLQSGEKELVTGSSVFNEKLGEAQKGSEQAVSGSSDLSSGLSQLSDGSVKLADGTEKLADGSKDLTKGTTQLKDGTKELHSKLSDASNETSSVKANDKNFDMMASPVKLDSNGINKVPNYGTGFAPYFLSLGLFVGSLLMSIVFPLVEPAIRPKNGVRWFSSKLAILAGIGVIQALIAVMIIILGLKLEVESLPLFILTAIVTSLAFMTLIQMLVSILGDPGRFIAILILIFQLTTSAGTFPLELIPNALQPINAFLPMTYTVRAFKAAISTGDFSYLWHNIFILLMFVISFAIISLLFFRGLFKRKFTNTVEEN